MEPSYILFCAILEHPLNYALPIYFPLQDTTIFSVSLVPRPLLDLFFLCFSFTEEGNLENWAWAQTSKFSII
jgi:hypothetical protein